MFREYFYIDIYDINYAHNLDSDTMLFFTRDYSIRGLFVNYWDSLNLNMEETQTWFYMTGHQLNFSLYVKYQMYGFTWSIAEGIRRASPGGMNSPHRCTNVGKE